MPNIEGEQTELELENQLIEQLRRQFHTSETEDAFIAVHNDAQLLHFFLDKNEINNKILRTKTKNIAHKN